MLDESIIDESVKEYVTALHISDIHIDKNRDVFNALNYIIMALRECTKSNLCCTEVECVIVTGDIFDMSVQDYDVASQEKLIEKTIGGFDDFIDEVNEINVNINSAVKLDRSKFIFVPGNHDVKRPKDVSDINSDQGDYALYLNFISKFYHDQNNYYYCPERKFSYISFNDKKIAVIGLNSNHIGYEIPSKKNVNNTDKKIKGYAKIQIEDIRDIVREVKNQYQTENRYFNCEEWTIVACFHHHFYLFPEKNEDKIFDDSIVQDANMVIDNLLEKNVQLVLHGHKHCAVTQPLANKNYYQSADNNKILNVFAAGKINCELNGKAFHLIDLYPVTSGKIAELNRFSTPDSGKYDITSCDNYKIPPEQLKKEHSPQNIEHIFKMHNNSHYKKYQSIIDQDKISREHNYKTIIDLISNVLTLTKESKKELNLRSEYTACILNAVLYRIHHNKYSSHDDIAPQHGEQYLNELSVIFQNNLKLVQTIKEIIANNGINHNLQDKYNDALDNFPIEYHRLFSYICIAIYFVDFFLSLTKYEKKYEENLNINFRLDPNSDFHCLVPDNSIVFTVEEDRRAVVIQARCFDPTAHKIAAVLIKDFEKKILYVEKCFEKLDLKIFYLLSKILPANNSYHLSDYNFEAYIPKLIPLLTGTHLYSSREVFIRELIQNSLDAMQLRDELSSIDESSKHISVEFKKIGRDDKTVKCIKIRDYGIGMNLYRIQRYFTSIGRSFYTSNEYQELRDSNDFKYHPVSNFGIGFLSTFMISDDVFVRTRYFDDDKPHYLEIGIPNFDGCFFVKDITDNDDKFDPSFEIGTEIILFENSEIYPFSKENIQNIISYIKDNFLYFDIPIQVSNTLFNDNQEEIIRHKVMDDADCYIFEPFDSKNNDEKSNGLFINFSKNRNKGQITYLNSGIKVEKIKSNILEELDYNNQEAVYYIFLSDMIELDVSRDEILMFKTPGDIEMNCKQFFQSFNIKVIEKVSELYSKSLLSPNESWDISTSRRLRNFLFSNNHKVRYDEDLHWNFVYNIVDNNLEITLKKFSHLDSIKNFIDAFGDDKFNYPLDFENLIDLFGRSHSFSEKHFFAFSDYFEKTIRYENKRINKVDSYFDGFISNLISRLSSKKDPNSNNFNQAIIKEFAQKFQTKFDLYEDKIQECLDLFGKCKDHRLYRKYKIKKILLLSIYLNMNIRDFHSPNNPESYFKKIVPLTLTGSAGENCYEIDFSLLFKKTDKKRRKFNPLFLLVALQPVFDYVSETVEENNAKDYKLIVKDIDF